MGSDHQEEQARTSPPTRGVRAVRVLAAAALIGILALVALRVFIAPVAPTQKAPALHPELPCWLCHIVSESIDEVEIP